jgi:hypothetical protein
MKTEKLPVNISEYINNNFTDDFLVSVKDVRSVKGQPHYFIEVSKDDYIHMLEFNETGVLVSKRAEQAFPPDNHDSI